MRWAPPRRHLGGVAGDEREADATVVQEDAGAGFDEMRTEVQRVGLRERDPEAVGVLRAQVRGVAVAEAGHVEAGRAASRGHVGRRHGVRLHAGSGGGQALGVEQRGPVGAVVEHGGAVVADGAPRLDEEVGPLRVVRVGAESGRLGHRGAGQRQVALRRRRHRPQLVAPGAGAQGFAPGRRTGGEVRQA